MLLISKSISGKLLHFWVFITLFIEIHSYAWVITTQTVNILGKMKIAEIKPASKVLDSTTLSDNIYTIYITLTQKLIDNPTF